MKLTELIDQILTDLGEPLSGTGMVSRTDCLRAIDKFQRQISRECRNIVATTATLEPLAAATSITIDANGNLLEIIKGKRTYGGTTRPIYAYSSSQIEAFDSTWNTKTGELITGVIAGLGTQGTVRPYPIPDNANNDLVFTYLKIATRVTQEFSEAGDAATQLSDWYLTGITDTFLATGNILYWALTNVTTTRTVKLYSNSAMTEGYLVAQGSRTGDGSITLAEANDSGISGTVTVAYTVDDATSANTLTFNAVEIPDADTLCLEYAVKSALLRMEKDSKDFAKADYWEGLYKTEKEEVKKRARQSREGTFRTIQERTDVITDNPPYPFGGDYISIV